MGTAMHVAITTMGVPHLTGAANRACHKAVTRKRACRSERKATCDILTAGARMGICAPAHRRAGHGKVLSSGAIEAKEQQSMWTLHSTVGVAIVQALLLGKARQEHTSLEKLRGADEGV